MCSSPGVDRTLGFRLEHLKPDHLQQKAYIENLTEQLVTNGHLNIVGKLRLSSAACNAVVVEMQSRKTRYGLWLINNKTETGQWPHKFSLD